MFSFEEFPEFEIPARGNTELVFELIDGAVFPECTVGGRKSELIFAAKNTPELSSLSRSIRKDGSISITTFLAFISRYRENGRLSVEIYPPLNDLTLINKPADLTVCFMYNEKTKNIRPVAEADNSVFYYDGRGFFVSDGAEYFKLDAISTIDSILDDKRTIAPPNFTLLYKLIYPKLKTSLNVYSDLTYKQVSPLIVSLSGETSVEVKWQKAYDDIHFFKDNSFICEVGNELLLSCKQLENIAPELRSDGSYELEGALHELIYNLYLSFPSAFTPELATLFNSRGRQKSSPGKASPAGQPSGYKIENLKPPLISCTLTKLNTLSRYERSKSLLAFMSRTAEMKPIPCRPSRFSAYALTFDNLTPAQLSYYVYVRELYRKHEGVKCDYSYILLMLYEALNTENSLELIYYIWEFNRSTHIRLDRIMPELVRDYIVIYKLDIPFSSISKRIPFSVSVTPNGSIFLDTDFTTFTPDVYPAISGYAYYESRFFSDENKNLIHDAYRNGLSACENYMKDIEGRSLFDALCKRTSVASDYTYGRAVATPEHSYMIEYRYSQIMFNREVCNYVANIFKICENILRKQHSFKGKLKELPIEPKLREYIETALAPKKQAKKVRINIDISTASEIERSSWNMTDRLIREANTGEYPDIEDSDNHSEAIAEAPPPPLPVQNISDASEGDGNSPYSDLIALLSQDELEYLTCLYHGCGKSQLDKIAASALKLPDTIIDSINSKAVDTTGDIIIYDNEIIEDYADALASLIH